MYKLRFIGITSCAYPIETIGWLFDGQNKTCSRAGVWYLLQTWRTFKVSAQDTPFIYLYPTP